MTAAVVFTPLSFTPASMAPPTPATSVVVKLSLRGETFRITYAPRELTWEAICAKVHDCYDDAHRPSLWTLVYRDNEDDLVTVSNALEFVEAYRVSVELTEQPTPHKLYMHFYVVARVSLIEQLAPAMQAVTELSEKVTRLAAETRDSLRKGSYVERGRESIYVSAAHTRVALSSAGRGLSQRVRRATTVVAGEISEIRRRARTRSRGASRDGAYETSPHVLFATNVDADHRENEPAMANVVDLLARARAEQEEAERLAMEQVDRTPATASEEQPETTLLEAVEPVVDTSAARAAPEEDGDEDSEERHASDAETCSTASEDTACEWDFVPAASSQALSASLSPYFKVDTDDEMEASFSRWEAQLKTIRDIMPQLDTAFCIDILDKHDGNLEATLVELMEL